MDTTNDFNWQMQLRYYWNEEDDTCLIRQTNSSFNYAYEYLGRAVQVDPIKPTLKAPGIKLLN